MAKDQKLAASQVFGQWTLVGEEELGRGGNGVVWQATNARGDNVAIKFLHKHHIEPPGKRFARFRDEVLFLQQEGKRDGLLPLIDAHVPDAPTAADRPWFTTPLAVPFTKLHLAGAAKLPDLVHKLERVALTLAGLHNEGKYHRDLKPGNLLELDGAPVVGDFGLVDFPGKDAVTESSEILGPLYYVAPEMMKDAADVPAGPADVYSLGKVLWVLASGQTYPLPGEMRVESEQLRLSTYCPHPRARQLDVLLELATRHESRARPPMEEFARELKAWTESREATSSTVDVSDLAREYQSVFIARDRDERRRQDFIDQAMGILSQFRGALQQVAFHTEGVTRIAVQEGEAFDLPERVYFQQAFGRPRVLARQAHQVETASGNLHRIRLQSFVQVEALGDERVRVVVGHLLRYQAGASQKVIRSELPWAVEATEVIGSASLDNELQVMYRGFVENVRPAIQRFAEWVSTVPNM
jgi:hypothetical protein